MCRIFRGPWSRSHFPVLFVSLPLLVAACSQPGAQPAAPAAPEVTSATPAPVEVSPAPTASDAPAGGSAPGPALTPEACQAQGGQVLTDPGDGSLHRRGCPEGRATLGSVRLGIEGGLCCAAPSPAPPQGKRAPCTFGADQTCNADPSVSGIYGRCTELGTCVCKAPAVLTPGGSCKIMP